LYFLLLMADGRKLRGKLLDRLTMRPRGQVLGGQARLITSDYDLWRAYPIDRDESVGGAGRDHQRGVPSPDERAGAGPAL
jgi:hypothetical protein